MSHTTAPATAGSGEPAQDVDALRGGELNTNTSSTLIPQAGTAGSKLEFHPRAQIFPLIEGAEFDELVADIAAHGLRCPIVLHTDGRILDGRNRYLACQEAGVEPRFETWDGIGLAADFVQSLNGPRRHLDTGAKQIAAGRYAIERGKEAKERQGARTDLTSSSNEDEVEFGRSAAKAADKFGLGQSTVERAVQVLKEGADELIAAVSSGKVSVSAAADVATKPKDEQREIVARGEREILAAAKAIRGKRVEEKRARIIAANDRLRARNSTLPQSERKYSVILADPPWSFQVWGVAGKQRAENHYPTPTLEDIKALPVEQLAADDCALFLWAVMPQLPEALAVIEAWGFTFKTVAFNWVKQNRSGEGFFTGMGYWTRANSEICLLATKGSPTRLNDDVHQVVMAPVAEHSRKPDEVANRIMRLTPGPYIELFARRPRDGWDVWGNEVSDGNIIAEALR
jgi:N6-adenosine-specific RNA methylase IME4